jgi:hypothetical protein
MLFHDLSGNGKMKREEMSKNKLVLLRKEKAELCKGNANLLDISISFI